MYDIVKLNMKECTFQVIYEYIEGDLEAKTLARYAMTEKTNDDELILILPHNSPLDKNSQTYKGAKELAERYKATTMKRHAFSLVEYAKSRRRRENG